jgi:hypothetical protein
MQHLEQGALCPACHKHTTPCLAWVLPPTPWRRLQLAACLVPTPGRRLLPAGVL